MRCCILVPVYNHPETLTELISRLDSTTLPLIVVNDGSDEPCTSMLRDLAARYPRMTVLEREYNGGKGAAVKTGLRAAAQSGYSHALQIDADGQHCPGDITRMLALAEDHPGAVITGVPIFHNVPRLRFYSRYLTHVWVWINTLSLDIEDALCGFRVYPLAETMAILDRNRTGDRMEFDPEILVRLHWAGVPVLQLATPVSYPENGISHFRGLRDNALISWMHTRLFFGMLLRLPSLLRRRGITNKAREHD